MRTRTNILFLAGWSWKDPLIQVYTLPYVRIVRKILPGDVVVVLATMEQPGSQLTPEERLLVIRNLAAEGIVWMPLHYRRFGITGLMAWMVNGLKLARVLFTRRIACIHAWCMPAGSLGYLLSFL